MKSLSYLGISLMLLFAVACGSSNNNENHEYTGSIEAAGITSYQYGTHRLITENETYALKSEKVDLSNYEGQKVTLIAEKMEGYPLEGGPVFLKVISIKE